MFRNRSAQVHQFSMIPKAEIPRSSFQIEHTHKTTFDAGYLIPMYVEEVLPGDTFNLRVTAFARLATPIVPVMDNLYLDTFFFFVPNRLVWDNWNRFMGERVTPNATIDYRVPEAQGPLNGYPVSDLHDYMGLPSVGQVELGYSVKHNNLPCRAYNLIWNEWFRDQNLQDPAVVDKDDGDDDYTNYFLRRRGKRHDYFTSCLPWVQKGESVTLPLGTSAPVLPTNTGFTPEFKLVGGTAQNLTMFSRSGSNNLDLSSSQSATDRVIWDDPGLYADLSAATAATINQLRQAFQIQKLLERDARGGTRYTELIRAHFGVMSPDARLQRPEYLGGGTTPVNIAPIAQTSATTGTGTDTPLGTLSAFGTATAHNHGFTQSFTEHGYVIGLMSVRADLNYQQGLRRMWRRRTRYDFYWPVFAMLGEQAVAQAEIFYTGRPEEDDKVFGYQERWAEYRYTPSMVSGAIQSTASAPLDIWHLAQKFATPPILSDAFIQDNPPIDRIIATTEQTGQQFIVDMLFKNKAARPLPMYSVPGLVDHF